MTVCEPLSRHLPRHPAQHRAQDVTLTWASADDDGPRTWGELAGLDWSRFRLVIGAGGASGGAFAAGALLALSTDHHVDLHNATHLVGTSAGSVIAGLIAMGLGGDDIAAIVCRAPQWVSAVDGSHDFTFSDDVPPIPKLRSLVRAMGPRDIVRSASLAGARRYRALWLHCVRPGTFDVSQQLHFIPELTWPARGRLSICCTDAATADRVVYERDSGVSLSDAISASCAVPGVMRPVSIDDRVIVDGGVVSPTNADVALADDETTLTVVVSPMSGSGAHSAVGRASSIFAANRLVGELRRCRPDGGVLVIEPSGALGALVIDDALDPSTATSILSASFLGPSQSTIDHRHLPARKRRAGGGPITN
jgi:NTE family protein